MAAYVATAAGEFYLFGDNIRVFKRRDLFIKIRNRSLSGGIHKTINAGNHSL